MRPDCKPLLQWNPTAHPNRRTPSPYLRLSGRWLEQHGFTPGSRVTVTAEIGKLVLTIANRRPALERSMRNVSAATGDAPSPKIT